MCEIEYDNEKEFNETIDKFEPMLNFPMSARDMESLKVSATVSIAISLKRIADVMTKQPIVMPELTSEELENMKEAYNKGGSGFNI